MIEDEERQSARITYTLAPKNRFPPGQWEVVVTATNTAGEGPVPNTVVAA